MLTAGDTVILAVSGGMDSVVMLHIMNILKDEFSLNLVVAHLNHGLRGRESARDFSFVKKLSASLEIPFVGAKLEKGEVASVKGLSLQEAARLKRYAFLEGAAKRHRATKIALGHNLDDQAETMLIRLIKGSSLAGLAGIHPARGKFIRPLIDTTRREIEDFVKENSLKYVTDSSNLKEKYLRNSVRLKLIPYIRKNYNGNVSAALARTATVLSIDAAYMDEETAKVIPFVMSSMQKNKVVMDRRKLRCLHEAVLGRLYLYGVGLLSNNTHSYSAHVRSFVKLIGSKSPNLSVTLPGGLIVLREYDRIIFTRKAASKRAGRISGNLIVPGDTTFKPSKAVFTASLCKKLPPGFGVGENAAYFDYDKIAKPVIVRTFIAGDRIRPLGMKGHKKLKDVFIEKKVPLADRPFVPILVSDGVIIWAVGVRQSEVGRVTPQTKRAIKIEYLPDGV